MKCLCNNEMGFNNIKDKYYCNCGIDYFPTSNMWTGNNFLLAIVMVHREDIINIELSASSQRIVLKSITLKDYCNNSEEYNKFNNYFYSLKDGKIFRKYYKMRAFK